MTIRRVLSRILSPSLRERVDTSAKRMTILPVLFGTLAGSFVASQDNPKTAMFPFNGNGTSLEMGSKMEPAALQPDMTRAVPTTLVLPSQQPQPQPMLPSDYFFPSKDFSILVYAKTVSFDHLSFVRGYNQAQRVALRSSR